MKILATILDFIFPRHCLSCKIRGTDICFSCLTSSPPAERECAEWIFPLYDYRHKPLKEAIWLLKYKNRKRIASILGRALVDRISEEVGDLHSIENFTNPILIPIPLSRKKFWSRGYNQAELIAMEIEKLSDRNLKMKKNILVKKKNTKQQAKVVNKEARIKNIIGSFTVKNPDLVKNKNIILVDDVVTTGATLGEAKKILEQSGAKKVIAFTVAH